MEALLCSKEAARQALGLGSTKTDELIAEGVLETVRIGSRRLVKISSVRRLAGIEVEHREEDVGCAPNIQDRTVRSTSERAAQ